MSKIVYKNLKDRLDKLYNKNFAVEIGLYDKDDNLSQERVIPLGNYIYDPLPSSSEKEIIQNLCSRVSK